jgi:exonuclease SbcD
MRILHTSDWHLGVSSGPASRIPEQRLFLDWLRGQLESQEIDALIIAGDIFDTMHPSAEAQTLYYRFLATVEATGVRDVVVIGGNHDSPSRLNAAQALLEAVRVHVVGGIPVVEERIERMLIPLRKRGSDEVGAVCLAVPYVHEFWLGIRTSDLDREQTRAEFRARFGELYTLLADAAETRFPGIPIVATGHLTLGTGSKREDYPLEIHRVGSIEGLPIELLDARICYTALGHIHRSYPVANTTAWYSGTPIPYSLTEMDCPRQVLQVDLGKDKVQVQPIGVPLQRELVRLQGSSNEVVTELEQLEWTTPMAPLVHIQVETEMAEPGLVRRLHDALEIHDASARPVLVEVKQRSTAVEQDGTGIPLRSLDELSTAEVFGLLCEARHFEGDDLVQLQGAFQVVQSTQGVALDALLDEIHTVIRAVPQLLGDKQ